MAYTKTYTEQDPYEVDWEELVRAVFRGYAELAFGSTPETGTEPTFLRACDMT